MSLLRLYSILNDDRHKVGRVKTPVLNIIAKRDEAIAAFTKVPFYKVVLENGAECEKVFETSEQAEAVRAKCEGKTVTVYSVKSERKKENRPLLHSLTSLQREANDIYGMTAADTLKAAQSLYEKKLITYPRTDSNYLSDDMISLVESIVKCLSSYDGERISRLLADGLNIDSRVIDNGKISDHHAIIPTNLIGRKFAASLPENVKSAELTARWEQALSDIENGVGNADSLLSKIIKSVSDIVDFEKSNGSRSAVSRTKTVGICPHCGKPVIENSKGFSCSARAG